MFNEAEKKRDRPWLMRTYSGHSSAAASNALYRENMAKGQTGLSVAFDLPTQTGYDSDHALATGEVGKVGVPIDHIEDLATLFKNIPLEKTNTSMTINATAPWLLALYVALAQRQGLDVEKLTGTTQNDILKEYLSRGTYIFPPQQSVKLASDVVAYSVRHLPKWNPINVCSYHLQEAGATPVQELAYAFASAFALLDQVKLDGVLDEALFHQTVGRISFFVNAGIRFVEELCKMRAFVAMWDEIAESRYGVQDARLRRFRYGVQVNSLGLTETQPENNVQRIVLEMLGVTLSKTARARAVQLPAWNEALGLPRPWDQQWALRMQQVLAFETDLLEYPDIFEGSPVIENLTKTLVADAEREMADVDAQGGMVNAIESGYVKRALVRSHVERIRGVERGDLPVVGVNCFTESTESPLNANSEGILRVDSEAEREQVQRLQQFRKQRDPLVVTAALAELRDALSNGTNIMPASIVCAHAGVTTGEWSNALREQLGEYRAPTGIDIRDLTPGDGEQIRLLRERTEQTAQELERQVRIVVAKPGLDGHSNGAEQVAVKGRDVGFEVIYEGIRSTPKQIARSALEEGVHLIGLSILSGSHLELVGDLYKELQHIGIEDVPVTLGGIIPEEDEPALRKLGIRAVYTPKDTDLNSIMHDMLNIIRSTNGLAEFDVAA